jgi:hypothetical protein
MAVSWRIGEGGGADASLSWMRAAWGRNPVVHALLNAAALVAALVVVALIVHRAMRTAKQTGVLRAGATPAPRGKGD